MPYAITDGGQAGERVAPTPIIATRITLAEATFDGLSRF
jgi:hypothetical protein